MAFTASTRLCGFCRIPLSEPPAAPVCERCDRVHVPHHEVWPLSLKWWLLAEWLRTRFLHVGGEQQLWEELLRDALNGVRAGKGPNPAGTEITMGTPAVDLYPMALQRAAEWKAAGSSLSCSLDSSLSRSTDSSKVA